MCVCVCVCVFVCAVIFENIIIDPIIFSWKQTQLFSMSSILSINPLPVIVT